jgi:hypothetical protein
LKAGNKERESGVVRGKEGRTGQEIESQAILFFVHSFCSIIS